MEDAGFECARYFKRETRHFNRARGEDEDDGTQQLYVKVMLCVDAEGALDSNFDNSVIGAFEGVRGKHYKDKLGAELVAVLEADPTYDGMQVSLREKIKRKFTGVIVGEPRLAPQTTELGGDTDIFNVKLHFKQTNHGKTLKMRVEAVPRSQLILPNPPPAARLPRHDKLHEKRGKPNNRERETKKDGPAAPKGESDIVKVQEPRAKMRRSDSFPQRPVIADGYEDVLNAVFPLRARLL